MTLGIIAVALILSHCFVTYGKVVDINLDKEIEERSFKSIKSIHKHLDDDQDGSVNLQESNEFMVDELKVDDKKRHSSFHNNDNLISVDDLWNTWQRSEVHNWTNDDVLRWLTDIVGLPQYRAAFFKCGIDGRMLPRFTNESSSLYVDLGITNPKHRKKIYLLATDIVLFGLPNRDYTKDIVLAVVVMLMTLACLYSLNERKFAKRQMEQMLKDVECMQQAEETLKNTQQKLMEAEKEHVKTEHSKREIEEKLKEEIEAAKKEAERLHEQQSHHQEARIKLSLVEQELCEVRKALQKAEAEMEAMQPKSSKALQQWLFITYKKESKYFSWKKAKAMKQMEDAKDACDKIHKKRGSLFGPLRLVHSQTIGEVDQKILQARSALAEVTNDMQERQHRWRQIEELCGFQIAFDGHLGHAMELNEKVKKSSIAEALAICANLGGMGSIYEMNEPSLSISSHEEVRCLSDPHSSSKSEMEFKRSVQRKSSDGISNSGCAPTTDTRARVESKGSANAEQIFRSFEDKESVLTESRSERSDTREHFTKGTKLSDRKSRQNNLPVSNSAPALPRLQRSPQRSSSLSSHKTDAVDSRYSNESNTGMSSFEICSSEESLAMENNPSECLDPNEVRKYTFSAEEISLRSPDMKKALLKFSKKKPASFEKPSGKTCASPESTKRRSFFSKLKKKQP